jgi:hypothetical protein
MNQIFKNILIGALSAGLCSQVAMANPFMTQARTMVENSKKLFSAQIRYQYNLAAVTSLEYLQSISAETSSEKSKLSQNLAALDDDIKTIRNIQVDGSIEGFRKFADKVSEAQRKARATQVGITSLEAYLFAARERVESSAAFCEKNVPLIKRANLTGVPVNHLIGPQINYSKYWTLSSPGDRGEGSNFFSGDPVVGGAAIWASSLTFTGAMLYAIAKGGLSVAFAKATGNVLWVGFTAELGSTVALTGAFIGLTAGVAVIAIAATIWANERNRERKAEAEKEFAELERQYNEARDWYHASMPDQNAVVQMADEICRGADHTAVLTEFKASVRSVLDDTQSALQEVAAAREAVNRLTHSLAQAYDSYKVAIARIYDANMIENAEKSLKENESATLVWERFNQDIKPRLMAIHRNLTSTEGCAKKAMVIGQTRNEVEAEFHLLEDLNQGDFFKAEWANAKSRSLKALKQMETLLKDCAEVVAEEGDVYDF